MTMLVCLELGKTEDEVATWKLDDLIRWMAFFRLKAKAEEKAMERARKNKGGPKNGGTVTKY